jgi:hypothetical protein
VVQWETRVIEVPAIAPRPSWASRQHRVPEGRHLATLEQELQRSRNETQTTREGMQSAQEELKSINEELRSAIVQATDASAASTAIHLGLLREG